MSKCPLSERGTSPGVSLSSGCCSHNTTQPFLSSKETHIPLITLTLTLSLGACFINTQRQLQVQAAQPHHNPTTSSSTRDYSGLLLKYPPPPARTMAVHETPRLPATRVWLRIPFSLGREEADELCHVHAALQLRRGQLLHYCPLQKPAVTGGCVPKNPKGMFWFYYVG